MNRIQRTLTAIKLALALSLGLGLTACSNQTNNEPQVQTQSETIELSSTLALEEMQINELSEEELKALNFQLAPNGNYRKPIIQFTEGQSVPVLCVIRNEAGVAPGRPVIVSQVTMTYKDGKLVAERLPLDMPTGTNLTANPNGWRMICIVGHDSFTVSSASFSSSSVLPGNAALNNIRPIKTLYMNKDKGGAASWTKLNVVNNGSGGKAFVAAEDTHLVSQGSMFFFDAENNSSINKIFSGVSIESNTLSFAGSIEGLSNIEVSEGLPKFVGTSSFILAKLGVQMNILANNKLGAYVVYGIPDANATTNTIAVTGRTGSNYTKARSKKFTFNPKPNSFYGLGNVLLKKNFTLPIEAMLFNEETSQVFVGGNTTYHTISNRITDGEYKLLLESYARALFPGLYKNSAANTEGTDAYGIVDFGRGSRLINEKEFIDFFGTGGEFYGDYLNPIGNNVSYAIRFKGGSDNQYLSAYRYERLGTADSPTGVKITVRHLGPTRTSTTLDDISNDAYWRTSPAPGQKQIERVIPKGRYYTKSTRPYGTSERVSFVIRIFETENNTDMRYAKGSVYIADMPKHMASIAVPNNEIKYLPFTQNAD